MKQSDEFTGESDPMNATLPLEIEEFPTPKLGPKGRDEADSIKCTLPSGAIPFKGALYHTNPNACLTPPKRCRESVIMTPGSDEEAHDEGTKRKPQAKAIPSYTDPSCLDGFELPASQFFNPDEIDGEPVELPGEPIREERKSTTIVLPVTNRPLIRRATDFPMPPPSPGQSHAPTPRSAATILSNVLGVGDPVPDPVTAWRKQREDHKCPLCLDVLVRPVDVVGCGHFVCRTHVIDMYQHGGSRNGIRCCVCRKEENVEDFNRIEIDQSLWTKIQRAKFHHSRRKSVSPSRSLTPLRERFDKRFLNDDDF